MQATQAVILLFCDELTKLVTERLLKTKTELTFQSFFIHQFENEELEIISKKVLLEIPLPLKKADEIIKKLKRNNCQILALATLEKKEIKKLFYFELGQNNVIQIPIDNNLLIDRILEFIKN
ncbi:hypothetical protein KKC17_01500 [Patescibacteria group bacterium]|nr:hypothetical protein [Patescibacteria group bacterium]